MLVLFFFMTMFLVLLILILFFLAGKNFSWEESMSSSFECGFTSYFFSRYSFSMHYFLVGILFLFLDLELCFVMPFFNGEISSFTSFFVFNFFILILILGILFEWSKDKLDWKF